jgi:cell division protease FtsH
VKRLVAEGFATARRILTKKQKELESLAKGLLEYETLSGDEIVKLLKGQPPRRDDSDSGKKAGKPSSSVPRTGGAKRGASGSGDMEPQPQS